MRLYYAVLLFLVSALGEHNAFSRNMCEQKVNAMFMKYIAADAVCSQGLGSLSPTSELCLQRHCLPNCFVPTEALLAKDN